MADWIDVAAQDEFIAGTRRVVETDVGAIAVFNLDGDYYAIEDKCSHDGGELASGTCDGDEIICPRHGARFCIRNGQSLTPPAYEDIEVFPVRISNAMIQVTIES
ncbi:MAG: non-heme iron oxygenase ferredoxin subunit [Mariprofundaceae bacterium]|nr:non-heme iron oxygenase ferredoxin subunit [Mariprofundaceae bacterium]